MKLSEAIRLGSMLKSQVFDGDRQRGGSCALRAAADAVGMPEHVGSGGVTVLDYAALRARWPLLNTEVVPPDPLKFPDDLLCIVFRLNDSVGWTREQIADWVETLELAEQPAQPEATTSDAVASLVVHGK